MHAPTLITAQGNTLHCALERVESNDTAHLHLSSPGLAPVYAPTLVKALEGKDVARIRSGQHHTLALTHAGAVQQGGYGRVLGWVVAAVSFGGGQHHTLALTHAGEARLGSVTGLRLLWLAAWYDCRALGWAMFAAICSRETCRHAAMKFLWHGSCRWADGTRHAICQTGK